MSTLPPSAPVEPASPRALRQCAKLLDQALATCACAARARAPKLRAASRSRSLARAACAPTSTVATASRARRRAAPRVKALLSTLSARGCSLHSPPALCEDVFSGAPALAAYDASRRAVVMNPAVPPRYLTAHQWSRGLTHELVHAFDDCRVHMRQDSPAHMACTEIRAANLSGDCDYSDELRRTGPSLRIAGVQRECVRRRTRQSLAMHPAAAALDAAELDRVIDGVFEPCYRDTAPFATN